MEVEIYDLEGNPVRKMETPSIFNSTIRPDLVKRVMLAQQSHRFQPKGRDPLAGMRTTAESWGTGRGASRMPRVKGEGYSASGAAALAPGTVGGRLAHPTTSAKSIRKLVNRKERRAALRSAIAATSKRELVAKRGHVVEKVLSFPLVTVDDIQKIKKTKDVRRIMTILGLWSDVLRASEARGRVGAGPLIVVDQDEGVGKAISNIPGVEVVKVGVLNAEILAPGSHPGRLTLWSESAAKKLDELFCGD